MDCRGRIILAMVVLGLVACERASQEPSEATGADEVVMRRAHRATPLPKTPADPTNRVAEDPAAAHLGQWLFFDTRLSGTGKFSCATCHDPGQSFSDGLPLAEATDIGTRHTPSLRNVAHHRWVGWDGRSDSIWAQALRPMEHPAEMGGDRVAIVRLIGGEKVLREAYEQVFGALPLDIAVLPEHGKPGEDASMSSAWEGLDIQTQHEVMTVMANIGKALAAYQRQLENRDSPFDRYMAAVSNDGSTQGTLSAEAVRGMAIFFGRGECWECHTGPLFSDGEFHNIGVPPPGGGLPRDPGRFRGSNIVKNDPFNAAGAFSDASDGPWARVVGNAKVDPETWGAFKTPSLRGVAQTPPYMHAGQFQTLSEVIRFYSTLEGAVQLDHHQEAVLSPLGLSEQEIAELEAFLMGLEGVEVPSSLVSPPMDPRFEAETGTSSA